MDTNGREEFATKEMHTDLHSRGAALERDRLGLACFIPVRVWPDMMLNGRLPRTYPAFRIPIGLHVESFEPNRCVKRSPWVIRGSRLFNPRRGHRRVLDKYRRSNRHRPKRLPSSRWARCYFVAILFASICVHSRLRCSLRRYNRSKNSRPFALGVSFFWASHSGLYNRET